MAIQAIGNYAEKTYSGKTDVSLDVEAGSNKHSFKVNKDNSIVQQTYEVKSFSGFKFVVFISCVFSI